MKLKSNRDLVLPLLMYALLAIFIWLPIAGQAASLCDEAGCDVQLVFSAGGGIRSEQSFTLDLGQTGQIIDYSGADVSLLPTSNIKVLSFEQGGEIQIVAGNLHYADGSQLSIDGVNNLDVSNGANVAIETVVSVESLSLNAPIIKVEPALTPNTGIAVTADVVGSTIGIQAGKQIKLGSIESAALIDFVTPDTGETCQTTADSGVNLSASTNDLLVVCDVLETSIDWAVQTDTVKEIWLGQDVTTEPDTSSLADRFGFISFENATRIGVEDSPVFLPVISDTTWNTGFVQTQVSDVSAPSETFVSVIVSEPMPIFMEESLVMMPVNVSSDTAEQQNSSESTETQATTTNMQPVLSVENSEATTEVPTEDKAAAMANAYYFLFLLTSILTLRLWRPKSAA